MLPMQPEVSHERPQPQLNNRIGGDQLLVGENRESRISMEDFAIALIDELKAQKHSRQRFTIGY